jgi:hypothetical protein
MTSFSGLAGFHKFNVTPTKVGGHASFHDVSVRWQARRGNKGSTHVQAARPAPGMKKGRLGCGLKFEQ